MIQQPYQEPSPPTEILLTQDNYVFKMLYPSHFHLVFELITGVFMNEQPLVNAFYRTYPPKNTEELENLHQIWKQVLVLLESKLSVGCFDAKNNSELVGISFTKDYLALPQGFDGNRSAYSQTYYKFDQKLTSLIQQPCQSILAQKGAVIDILAVTIKPEHTRKGILKNMMKANMMLGRNAGYKYALCLATNFKTSLTTKKLKFDLKAEIDASTYEIEGKIPFAKIDKEHRFSRIWMRELTNLQEIL